MIKKKDYTFRNFSLGFFMFMILSLVEFVIVVSYVMSDGTEVGLYGDSGWWYVLFGNSILPLMLLGLFSPLWYKTDKSKEPVLDKAMIV